VQGCGRRPDAAAEQEVAVRRRVRNGRVGGDSPAAGSRPAEAAAPALAAVEGLILSCHSAAPSDLPDLAMRAAAALDAEAAVMYLVDYAQTYFAPFSGRTTPARDRLAVDGTLAGRAYALGEICTAAIDGGGERVWVPLIDCGHRVGVLEVFSTRPVPAGHYATLSAFAAVLAMLVGSRQRYADEIEQLRRGLPMQLATEVVWTLLPPLTFGTPEAVVTGILEPCYEVGGDAFDYAAAGDVLHVALFDAVGHGIGASAMTTLAVNAYRNARRCGLDLRDTCRSVDKWIQARHPDHFVTAVLAELDLGKGVLRSICAGHPGGLLLRDGQLVKDLPAPTALPLGLCEVTGEPLEITEESLEPGDHVLFYTDGVVEARNDVGDFFGKRRLTDFVVRTLADRVPPSETMRRLVRAILEYQHERLQDDATAVLVRWNGR
jgi:serine phosphatase RsbU (regulator of sigma subunit)